MNIKALSAIALMTTALSTPVFAQDADSNSMQKPAHALRHYRSSYNQAPAIIAPHSDGYGEIDPSRVRPGEQPYANVPGN